MIPSAAERPAVKYLVAFINNTYKFLLPSLQILLGNSSEPAVVSQDNATTAIAAIKNMHCIFS